MAFEPDTLARARELEPAMATILLVGRREGVSPIAAPALAQAFGASGLGLDHRLVDASVLAAARQAGLGVAAWTVNDEAAMRRLIDLGVDTLITDRPDVALALLGRLG
jgi:glycerophosphoryl diester phosphodiesterase